MCVFLITVLIILITAHLDRSLKIARDEIETYTESTISKQKDIANEVHYIQTKRLFFWSLSILCTQYKQY